MVRSEAYIQASRNYRRRKVLRLTLKVVTMAFIFALVIAPLVWMIITSFKGPREMYTTPVNYWPKEPTLEYYEHLLNKDYLLINIWNSVKYSVLAPLMTVVLATMSSYILTRVKFPGSKLVMMFFIMTQMLPGAAAVMTMYMFMARLNLVNKLSTMIVMSGAGGIPFAILMLQGFVRGVPIDIEEAALIDGCSRWQGFVRIVVPLLRAGIFTVFIFQFINCWNNTYGAMIYLENSRTQTLPVLIFKLVGKTDINWGEVAAGTTISLIPTCILFGLMKNFFVAGITAGAVKG